MSPDQPITAAASRLLRRRLKAVSKSAPLAADKWKDDPEHVHRLRVSTRRARATLQLFADLLPRRKARWMKRRLKEIRQAAGTARDLDVLAGRLQQIADKSPNSHLRPLMDQIVARRRKAQKPLVTVCQKSKLRRFQDRSRSLVKAVRWRQDSQEPTFADSARIRFTPIVDEFLNAATADLSDTSSLHALRIAGKHVRYAMELLKGAMPEAIHRDLKATLKVIQDQLGIINDHATAIALFKNWYGHADCDESRAELTDLIATQESQLDLAHSQFRASWTPARISQLTNQFSALLK